MGSPASRKIAGLSSSTFHFVPFGVPERLLPLVPVERRLLGPCRLVIIVVNRHPQFFLCLRRLSADLPVDIYVPVDYLDCLAGPANQPLDIIFRRVKRVFEHHHVELLRLFELVYAFSALISGRRSKIAISPAVT